MPADVFYSISPFGTGDIKVACNISISGGVGVATFSVAQTGNIGVGCHVISSNIDGFISVMTNSTTATIVSALGVAHGNVSSETLTSISHEYASVSAFEAGFTDVNHINDTDLIVAGADVIVHGCCYFDHDDQTPDSTSVTLSWSGTTDATNYLEIFTPNGGAESINNQRHSGLWDTNKWHMDISGAFQVCINCDEDFVKFKGLQILQSHATQHGGCLNVATPTSSPEYDISYCILRNTANGERGIEANASSTQTIRVWNTIIYDCNQGMHSAFNSNISWILYNITVSGCDVGVNAQSSNVVTSINSLIYDNTTDFANSTQSGSDYNFSKDDTAPGGNSIHGDTDGMTPDFVNTGAGTEDFHIQSTSDAIDAGIDDPGSGLFLDDIDGGIRTSPWDIGADEFVAVVVTGNNYYYRMNQ